MDKGDDFTRLVAYVEERTILEERLQKMEAFRGSIKEVIFRRVQRDYTTRLTTIRDQFRPTMMDIVKKLRQIEADKDKLTERIDSSNDNLSELRFRNEIGEFNEELFHDQEDGLLIQLEELSGQFDHLRQTVGDYMFYLHDDKDFRQMATAEKILERLEDDFKAERARSAEAEQVRRQAQKMAAAPPTPAKPTPALPPAVTASRNLPAPHAPAPVPVPAAAPADEYLSGEIVDDEAEFLEQAFARFDQDDSTRDLGTTVTLPAIGHNSPHREAQPPQQRPTPPNPTTTPAGGTPARRIPDGRTDPRLQKSKVIRRAPNSGT